RIHRRPLSPHPNIITACLPTRRPILLCPVINTKLFLPCPPCCQSLPLSTSLSLQNPRLGPFSWRLEFDSCRIPDLQASRTFVYTTHPCQKGAGVTQQLVLSAPFSTWTPKHRARTVSSRLANSLLVSTGTYTFPSHSFVYGSPQGQHRHVPGQAQQHCNNPQARAR
ncbi:hypothetical protein LZ30DRAFT_789988, partial [Colletotrichum cereale]